MLGSFVVIGAALVSLLVTLGVPHFWIDNLASFSPQMLVGLVALTLAALLRRARYSAAVGAVAAIGIALRVLPHLEQAETKPGGASALSWLVANVHTPNDRYDALLDLVRERSPDLIGLVETDSRWVRALDEPLRAYPHRVLIPRSDDFGMSLYSRLPLHDARERVLGVVPTITGSVTVAGKPLELALVHVLPPISAEYARRRNEHLSRVAELRPSPCGNLVVAGDFNLTPYSRTFGTTFSARFTRAGGLSGTFPTALPAPLRIPLDYAIATGNVSIRHEVERSIHSDHLPFVIHIGVH